MSSVRRDDRYDFAASNNRSERLTSTSPINGRIHHCRARVSRRPIDEISRSLDADLLAAHTEVHLSRRAWATLVHDRLQRCLSLFSVRTCQLKEKDHHRRTSSATSMDIVELLHRVSLSCVSKRLVHPNSSNQCEGDRCSVQAKSFCLSRKDYQRQTKVNSTRWTSNMPEERLAHWLIKHTSIPFRAANGKMFTFCPWAIVQTLLYSIAFVFTHHWHWRKTSCCAFNSDWLRRAANGKQRSFCCSLPRESFPCGTRKSFSRRTDVDLVGKQTSAFSTSELLPVGLFPVQWMILFRGLIQYFSFRRRTLGAKRQFNKTSEKNNEKSSFENHFSRSVEEASCSFARDHLREIICERSSAREWALDTVRWRSRSIELIRVSISSVNSSKEKFVFTHHKHWNTSNKSLWRWEEKSATPKHGKWECKMDKYSAELIFIIEQSSNKRWDSIRRGRAKEEASCSVTPATIRLQFACPTIYRAHSIQTIIHTFVTNYE